MNIKIFITIMIVAIILFIGLIIASVSDSKHLAWLRKGLLWKIARNRILFLTKEHIPLLEYPLSVFLSLDDEPKKIYVEQGYTALSELVSNKVKQLLK